MKTDIEKEFKKELKRTFARNLSLYAEARHLRQIDIAKRLGVSKATVSTWFSPVVSTMPASDTLRELANLLDVSMEALVKGEAPAKVPHLPTARGYKGSIHIKPYSVVAPLSIYSIPIYESVSAGFGAAAVDSVVDYTSLPFRSKSEADETICIKVQGDSMSPKIENGDLIQVHRQTSVDSGDIAVVLLDGDNGFVKKVDYTETSITLTSLNYNYPPIVLQGEDVQRVRVVGKVKKIIREI